VSSKKQAIATDYKIMHNINIIEYFWALLRKISVGLIKIWGFYLW